MRVVSLISGGKDSMLALHKVAEEHEVVGVLGIFPKNPDSYMFHSVNLHLLDAIAEALQLPLTKIEVSGKEEKEVEELAEQIGKVDTDALCIGGIESSYQKKRFERVCREVGLELLAPLWGKDPKEIMEEVIKSFETIIVSVSAMGLDESFLCRRIDASCLKELLDLNKKYSIHIAGEGGEFETLVLDAPLYSFRIAVESVKKFWDGVRGYCLIETYSKISKI